MDIIGAFLHERKTAVQDFLKRGVPRAHIIYVIEQMAHNNLADEALKLAIGLNNSRLIELAAQIVLNGTYGKEITELARQYFS